MSLLRFGAPTRVAVALIFLVAAPVAQAGNAIDSLTLSGVVRDGAGNLLEGVQVLVLGDGSESLPLAKGLSDAAGRYKIAGLGPGAYRIAAVKPGYQTFLGRVDTLVNATLDVLLRSGADAIRDPDRADSADWVLRLPTRSILRDITESPPAVTGAEADGPAEAAVRDMPSIRLDQWFVMGEGRAEPAALTDTRGSQTSAMVGGLLGEHGTMRFEGSLRRLDETSRSLAGVKPSMRQTSMLLDMSYATGRDGSLDVRAFYDRSDLDPLLGTAGSDPGSLHRAWGYDAAWSLQIDPESRLSVSLDYDDLSLRSPGAVPQWKIPDNDALAELANRRMGAAGTYESMLVDGHQVRLDVRAQFVDPPARGTGAALAPSVRADGVLDEGWTVRLDAEDSWSWGRPVSVVSGLGYRQSLAGEGFSVLTPRIGAAWTAEWVSLDVLLSYAETWFDRWATSSRPYGQERVAAGGLGYRARIELPITASLTLSGQSAYDPVELDGVAYPVAEPQPGQSPLYLTDGNASSRSASLAIAHDTVATRTSLRLTEGTAEGLLAPVPQLDLPVQLLARGSLSFRDGSLAVRVNPWGTEVVVEYRRVEQPAAFTESSVELRVVQDLLEALQGSWRLLLAARTASTEPETLEAGLGFNTRPYGPYGPRGQLFSAGLSVTF